MWLWSRSTSIIEDRDLSAHLNILTIRERQRLSLFINGTLAGQTGLPPSPVQKADWWGPVYIGGSKNDTDSLDGLIDEVAFYARALSSQEINEAHQERLSGPCKP